MMIQTNFNKSKVVLIMEFARQLITLTGSLEYDMR